MGEEEDRLAEVHAAWEVVAVDDKPIGNEVEKLRPEGGRFPSDCHDKGPPIGAPEIGGWRSQMGQLVKKDHLQERENQAHVGHPEEQQVRHGQHGWTGAGEGKSTSNFRTKAREIELRPRPRGTTMCDWPRDKGHRNASEDVFQVKWANDPPEATHPMLKHLRLLQWHGQCAQNDPTRPFR